MAEGPKHEVSVRKNQGGGPWYLGAECTCGWKKGSPGMSQAACEALGRRHLAWVELGSSPRHEEFPGAGTTLKKPTPQAVLAARIDAYLKRFERDPKVNTRSREGTSAYYNAGAFAHRKMVQVLYVSYQGAVGLTIEEATAYLAWLDAGGVGTHWQGQREKSTVESQ